MKNQNRMNILHLQPNLKLTCGVTRVVFQLMKNASPDSTHYVCCFGGNGVSEFKKERLRILHFPIRNNKIFFLFHALYIIYICKKHKITLIHAHHRYFDLLGSFVSRFLGIQTLTMVHSKVFSKKAFSYKADHFVAPSKAIQKHLMNVYNIPFEKITVINNFVDESDYQTPSGEECKAIREELGIHPEYTVVSFIGRFSMEKGVDVLLSAYRRLEHEYSDLFLLFIGDGEERKYMMEYKEKGMRNIKILMPQSNIARYYAISDIIVLPSRVDPFPLVMIEAGLMKRALLASNIDGIAEYIEDGVTGKLVERANRDDLMEGLRTLLNDAPLRSSLAEALHAKVMAVSLVGHQMPLYYKLYKQMTK